MLLLNCELQGAWEGLYLVTHNYNFLAKTNNTQAFHYCIIGFFAVLINDYDYD